MYIHEAITKAQAENLCIKRECWDSAKIEFDSEWFIGNCVPTINDKRWLPKSWELTADDWVVCPHPDDDTDKLPEPEPDPDFFWERAEYLRYFILGMAAAVLVFVIARFI